MEKLLTFKDVIEITGYSRMHIYRLVKAGKFPRGAKMSDKAVRFRKSDVENWIEERFKNNKA